MAKDQEITQESMGVGGEAGEGGGQLDGRLLERRRTSGEDFHAKCCREQAASSSSSSDGSIDSFTRVDVSLSFGLCLSICVYVFCFPS